ncbi:class I SAM-dependent methyltransferase [Bowmanella yangjiangensis]|uniref:Class I SAM-dependent methyltransferase n=1 Tax=Bowmanella yangjiangensis TaxID=2811230 RepID=A0ABS3CSK8_9ALTE|nr:class I SAM-dependent methyltransferase [Bowmanella yangjiangensis]MBN7820102.1 class I SAM-dependent methyltransferase [Bowmanella yangjiangensis]
MQTQNQPAFGADMAARYDSSRVKLQPLKDALHLQMQALFSALPQNARILCAGAGTGDELLFLAEVFPKWQFTLVDPADAMLARCQEKAQARGISQRCEFFTGFVHDLPEHAAFDAATSVLVAHFIHSPDARLAYFKDIAKRLKHGAMLVNAELSWNRQDSSFTTISQHWVALHKLAGLNINPSYLGDQVVVDAPSDISQLLASAGFSSPTLFYQALLIHAWYSKLTGIQP